jgi:GAF domain-containing protein
MATAAPIPANESERLRALRNAAILDTAPEAGFDAIVDLAAYICRAPISTITLVDGDRQWFKARVGLAEQETPREISFCAHAVAADAPLIVPDASADARFRDYPNVTGAPNIRFYAGIPLHDSEGFALGTLCVVDRTPRRLDEAQQKALRALALQAEIQVQLRNVATELRDALTHVKVLRDLLPMCAWCRKVRDDRQFWQNVDVYLRDHADVLVTHGICPDCIEKFDQ